MEDGVWLLEEHGERLGEEKGGQELLVRVGVQEGELVEHHQGAGELADGAEGVAVVAVERCGPLVEAGGVRLEAQRHEVARRGAQEQRRPEQREAGGDQRVGGGGRGLLREREGEVHGVLAGAEQGGEVGEQRAEQGSGKAVQQ